LAPPKNDSLRELLARRAKALAEEASRPNGHPSTENVQELELLAKIVNIRDAAIAPPSRKRWPVAAVLGLTLLIVSILLFVHIPETEIELDLKASEVSFVMSTQQALTQTIGLTALGASGLELVVSAAGIDHGALGTLPLDRPAAAIHLSVESSDKPKGTINLASLVLPAGTQVSLRGTRTSHESRLSLTIPEGSETTGKVELNGSVLAGLAGSIPIKLDLVSPRAILLQAGSRALDLDLQFADGAHHALTPNVAVRDLLLSRIDESQGLERTVIHQVSTVVGGTLYIESLNGKERKLRAGETVRFANSVGEFRTLEMLDDGVALRFVGRVQGMSTGWGEHASSLMPTYLEWLKANQALVLMWSVTLYVFGVVVAILRWWRVSI
jgi:hypothetical protein